MLFGRSSPGTWGTTILLTSIVIVVAAGVWSLWRPPVRAMTLLVLQLEGMALLACGLVPEDRPLNPGVSEWWKWFWDRALASTVGFNKLEFWTGLVLLALAAIVAAVTP